MKGKGPGLSGTHPSPGAAAQRAPCARVPHGGLVTWALGFGLLPWLGQQGLREAKMLAHQLRSDWYAV